MSRTLPAILVVDDEKNMRVSLQTILEGEDYKVVCVDSAEEGLRKLESAEFFMIITDARLGGMSGYEFLGKAKVRWPLIPIVMITAYTTTKLAVEAIKAGAMDYLAKPFAPEELLHIVERCGERYELLKENESLRSRSSETYRLEDIIGESQRMKELRQLIKTVAPTNATVLILGESGTGKELIAGAMHSLSQRSRKNYVRINCAAIPEMLLESELFGHEKGAFTGALKQKIGRVEEAHGGTIFLDEIGDMSRPLQAKLLRFLEDGSFTRVGGNEEHRVDVRLIAATNRDVIKAIEDGQFREDLYHRLNVVQFRPTPLRERGRDIILLAEHFLRHFNQIMGKHVVRLSKNAENHLLTHHWPGNVRELRNVIERAVILEGTEEVLVTSLPDFHLENRLQKGESPRLPVAQSLDDALAEYEKKLILTTIEQNRYSLSRSAEQLKMSRHALRYRMQRLNISLDQAGEDGADGNDGDNVNPSGGKA